MRLHTDPSILTPVRWYRTHPGVPPWPTPTPFMSLQWRTDPWRAFPLGEVYGEPRPFDPGNAPLHATGKDTCGQPDWFRLGEPYPSSLPPAEYNPEGLLQCCFAMKAYCTLYTCPLFNATWGPFVRTGLTTDRWQTLGGGGPILLGPGETGVSGRWEIRTGTLFILAFHADFWDGQGTGVFLRDTAFPPLSTTVTCADPP